MNPSFSRLPVQIFLKCVCILKSLRERGRERDRKSVRAKKNILQITVDQPPGTVL